MSVPRELLYPSVERAISSRQILSYVQSTSGSTTVSSAGGANNIRRFRLPQDYYLNPKQGYLQFKAKIVDDGGAANQQFRNGIGSLFRTVRVYVAGQLVEDCRDYNILQRMLIDSEADDATLNSNWDQGMGTSAALQAQTGSNYYIHKLRTGFFTQEKLIPLWALKGMVELEIEFATTEEACINTAGAIHYEVDDLRLITETHTLNSQYTASVEQAMRTTGIQIMFPSYESYGLQLIGTSNDIQINNRRRSVKGLLACIRPAANLNNGAVDWDFDTANLTSFNLKVGSQIYPNYDLPYGAPSLNEYKKALGKLEMVNNASQLTFANYITNPSKAFIGLDLEHFLSQNVISGMDWNVGDTILHTNHSASPSNAQLTAFVIYDVVISLSDRVAISR